MKVREWSVNDADNALLKKIKLNNVTVFNNTPGVTDADVWRDITDFDITTGTTYLTNNKLEFSKAIDDEGEDFYIIFEFSDASTYTTTTYNP